MPSRRRRGRRLRRAGHRAKRLLWILGLALGAFLLLLGVAYSPTLYSKNAMVEGREAFAKGQELLLAGDEAGAKEQFVLARSAFLDAERAASHPALKVLGAVPYLGRTPHAVEGLAQIGVQLSNAGFAVTDGLSELPDGLGSLSPQNGRIPLEAITQLQRPVADAAAAMDRAEDLSRTIPDSWVLGSVADAGRQLRERLALADDLASSASALLSALPEFAGGDGTRRYLVAGQNPAELRGTGGFIGVYSILTVKDGKMHLERFRDIATLPAPHRVEPPPEDLAAIYGGDLTSSAKATNLVPDAPTAAGLLQGIWDASAGKPIDGVIFVDPQALARLLEVTGPVDAPELDTTLTSDNAVPYLTNEAYSRFPGGGAAGRKDALGAATERVWNRFVASSPPREAIQALADIVSSGNLVLSSTDPAVQAAFASAGAAGEFRATGTDFFGSVINNAAGNKVDFFLQRDLSYRVELLEGGSAEAHATVTLRNDAPEDAAPGEVMGPYLGGARIPNMQLRAGDDLSIVGTYCAARCVLTGTSTADGRSFPTAENRENGLTLFSSTALLHPQEEKVLSYRFSTSGVWEPTATGGIYRLRIDAQQAVRPVTAGVAIALPAGMQVVSASPGVSADGGVLRWNGQVGGGVDIEVEFQQPLVQRSFTRFVDFLERPLSGL